MRRLDTESAAGERSGVRPPQQDEETAPPDGPVAELHRSVGNQAVQRLANEGAVGTRPPGRARADPAVSGGTSAKGDGSVEQRSPEAAREKQRRGEAQIVDVRSPTEFRRGHVPGAKNVPASELSRRASDLDGESEVVACCRSGRRSAEVARKLSGGVEPTVSNLRGGYEAWTDRTGDRDAGERPPSTGAGGRSGGDAVVQPKLRVSDPDDEHEREAERVAERVMRSPARRGDDESETPSIETGVCTSCQRRLRDGKSLDCEDCEDRLQRAGNAADEGGQALGDDVERKIESMQGGGRPLPDSTRSFFEDRFGRDFGDVRVHTGQKADEAARSIDAEAFTYGTDVAFRSGTYRPDSRDGKKLLAHELTHVVQQTGGGGSADANRKVMRYRAAGSANLGAGDDSELKEKTYEEFRDSGGLRKNPVVDNITVEFTGIKETSDETFPVGTLTATYKQNESELAGQNITAKVSGGTAWHGLSRPENNSEVHAIEGPGYHYQKITSETKKKEGPLGGEDTGQRMKYFKPEQAYEQKGSDEGLSPEERRKRAKQKKREAEIEKMLSWAGPGETKSIDPQQKAREYRSQTLRALMNYALYFTPQSGAGMALHEGYADEGSLACVHVPEPPIRQLNYHSWPRNSSITSIDISYSSSVLKELCCLQKERASPKDIQSFCKSKDCSDRGGSGGSA